MSLEAALAEHTAALKENNVLLTQVVAGQKAALEKIGEGKAGTNRAPKDKPAAPPAAGAEQPKTESTATNAAAITDDDLKATAAAWMAGKPAEERKAAAEKIFEMLEWMGFTRKDKLTGPESKLTDEQRKQAKFFIQRWAAGATVDFNTDYDFDGDPAQGAAAAEPDADPFG